MGGEFTQTHVAGDSRGGSGGNLRTPAIATSHRAGRERRRRADAVRRGREGHVGRGDRERQSGAAPLIFVGSGALPVVYALSGDGGGYDLVFRQYVALIVWSGLAIAFLFGLLPLARPSRDVVLPLAALGLLVAWTALSLTWTESSERTWAELARALHYLGLLVLAWTVLERRTWRIAAAGLSVGALVVCGLAVLSRLAPLAFPGAGAGTPDPARLLYPLGYWNGVGVWGAMSVGICLAWASGVSSPRMRGVGAAMLPVAGLAVYLSYSRTGASAAVLAMLIVLALAPSRRRASCHAAAGVLAIGGAILAVRANPEIAHGTGGSGGGMVALALAALCVGCWWASEALQVFISRFPSLRRGPAMALGLSVAIALVGLAAARGPQAGSEVGRSFHGTVPERSRDPATRLFSVAGKRSELWTSALREFESEPLHGTGAGTFDLWHSRESNDPAVTRDAHSLYLESLAELGLPGLVAVVGLLGGLAAAAIRARRRLRPGAGRGGAAAMLALFAVFLVGAGVDWLWELTAVSALALLGGAALVASGSDSARRRGLPGWSRAAIVAFAVVAAAVQVPGIVSTDRQRASARALAAGDPRAGKRFAEDAVAAEPWSADAHAQLALAWDALGRNASRRRELRKASDLEPGGWRWPLLTARLDSAHGQSAAARRFYRQARELRPALPADPDPVISVGSDR